MNSEATNQGATMQTTTIYRPYDGKAIAEQVVDAEGIIWERRLLINGPGRWYVIGSL